MTITQFEELSLTIGISGLVLLMFFILYQLAKENHAGRYGFLVIFMTLGLGVTGFLIKSVIQAVLNI